MSLHRADCTKCGEKFWREDFFTLLCDLCRIKRELEIEYEKMTERRDNDESS